MLMFSQQARNFLRGLMQYVVTIQHLLLCEEKTKPGLSIGRVDQYMYPFL